MYHRFNTRQREYWSETADEFLDINKDEIVCDDYDINKNSEQNFISTMKYNCYYDSAGKSIDDTTIPANIDPEGYYYNPHYSIKLRDYNDEIQQGTHRKVVFKMDEEKDYEIAGNTCTFITSTNYYLEVMKELYLHEKETGERKIATIINVEGPDFRTITIKAEFKEKDNINNYYIFKPNSEMPEYAYDLKDEDGRYLWRDEIVDIELDSNSEISSYLFTNGTHYINKNINFFLRRQDPTGYYRLSNVSNNHPLAQNLAIQGYENDYSQIEIIEESIEGIC